MERRPSRPIGHKPRLGLAALAASLGLLGCVEEQIAYLHNVGPAETIYSGGEIVTLDDARPRAEAIATKDGAIIAVGSLEQVERLERFDTVRIDLRGRTLFPAVVDEEGHVVPAQPAVAAESDVPAHSEVKIALGRPANFVVLSRNPLDLPPEERESIRVIEAFREGRPVSDP